jgi:opacity protein-like surface antigen
MKGLKIGDYKCRLNGFLNTLGLVPVDFNVKGRGNSMSHSKLFKCLCVCSVFLLFSSVSSIASVHDFEISGALGFSDLNSNDGSYQFSRHSLPPDILKKDRTSRSLNYKVGIGYNLFTEKLSENRFLNNLLLELNFYRSAGSIYGKTYAFGEPPPVGDDIDFQLNIDNNMRLMLDIKPSLFTWRGFSPYVVLGAGIGWIKTNYQEYNHNNPGTGATVNSATSRNFVSEGGVGLKYEVNEHASLFLEYLYTRYGKLKTYGAATSDGVSRPSSPEFPNMYTNTALLGLYIRM